MSVIATNQAITSIQKLFGKQKPKAHIDGLSSLSIEFVSKYVGVPNIFYSFIRCLALRRINIVEMVSTYTELTFILDEKDLERAFRIIKKTFK